VQVRAHGEEVPATAHLTGGDGLVVRLARPVRGVAPGQGLVLYDGTRVMGSATIATTARLAGARD
jgi:tRNA-specific 2-thiouridylase